MTRFHFLEKQRLYSSVAYRKLLNVIDAMEPSPVYPNVFHVPAMIEMAEQRGSDEKAAVEIVQEYFATPDEKKDLLFNR